jgi:hypothetical protein
MQTKHARGVMKNIPLPYLKSRSEVQQLVLMHVEKINIQYGVMNVNISSLIHLQISQFVLVEL